MEPAAIGQRGGLPTQRHPYLAWARIQRGSFFGTGFFPRCGRPIGQALAGTTSTSSAWVGGNRLGTEGAAEVTQSGWDPPPDHAGDGRLQMARKRRAFSDYKRRISSDRCPAARSRAGESSCRFMRGLCRGWKQGHQRILHPPGSRRIYQSFLYGVVHVRHSLGFKPFQTVTDRRLRVTDISHSRIGRED